MEATDTAYQVVAIIDGERKVIETVGTPEDAAAAQAALPFPTRIMALEGIGFDAATASHLTNRR